MHLSTLGRIGAGLVLATGLTMLGASPAQAAPDAKISYVKRVKPIQSVITYVSIKDHAGRNYPIKVTATWKYLSPTRAVLRSVVIRENGFPRGDCIYPEVWMATANWYPPRGSRSKLCDGGYRAYKANKTVRTRHGNVLGQLNVRTPNPPNPFCCGARTYTVQYNIAKR